MFIRGLWIRIKHLKKFRRYFLETSLCTVCIFTVCIAVAAAGIAIKRVLVGELLFYFRGVFQSFIIPLDQVSRIETAPDRLRKVIELEQAGLCQIKPSVGYIWILYGSDAPSTAGAPLPKTDVLWRPAKVSQSRINTGLTTALPSPVTPKR